MGSSGSNWQEQAWEFLDKVGELRYYVGWRSASVARCQLIGSDLDPDTGRPTGYTENAASGRSSATSPAVSPGSLRSSSDSPQDSPSPVKGSSR